MWRAWWKITFPPTIPTPWHEFCRAQLNAPGKQSHTDIHLREHQKGGAMSQWELSAWGQITLRSLTPQSLWSTSPLGMKGMWAACEGDTKLEARVTTGLMSVAYRGWNLSVTLWPAITPNTSHLPTPTTLSPHHQPLLPWVGTDVWILRRSHSRALIGPIGLNKGWHTAWRAPGQREAARTPIICLIVWGRYRGATANLRTVTWANEIIV